MADTVPPPFAVLDQLAASVFRLDRQCRILHANRWVCDQLGVRAADVIGRVCPDLGMPAEVWAAFKRAMAEAFDTGRTVQYEFLCGGPSERLVEYRFAPHPAADGQPESVWVVALTITEVHRLRTALREREALFHAFLDRVPAFAWLRDADSRYVFVNHRYLSHYHLTPADRLGKTPADVWPPDVAARLLANDRAVVDGGRELRVVETTPEPDGGVRHWLNLKFPFVGENGHQYIGGIGVDVTDQRAADERTARTAKLESLGLLAAGAAHDFNNLLTVVLGQATLALREVPADSPVAGRLREIQAVGERAGELCEQMLSFSGRRRSEPIDVNLAVIADDTARLTRGVLPPTVALHTDVPPDPVVVHADPTHLRQVVLNLMTNAADAMAGREGEVRVSVTAEGGRGVLTVSDQGCGMTPDTSARVFEPFFTTKPHGHGLGLAAVHGLVHAIGGEIRVTSAVDEGTTFRVEFPLAAGPTPA
jgi:PAS domain S-box-containing protein